MWPYRNFLRIYYCVLEGSINNLLDDGNNFIHLTFKFWHFSNYTQLDFKLNDTPFLIKLLCILVIYVSWKTLNRF